MSFSMPMKGNEMFGIPMNDLLILIALLFIGGAIALYDKRRHAKKAAEAKIEGEKQWAADYHNPASQNYDKARVEAEAAEAIANGECC